MPLIYCTSNKFCFALKGEETIDGVLAEKWQLVETIGQKKNKYTMWMNYRTDPDNVNAKIAVPLRYYSNKT